MEALGRYILSVTAAAVLLGILRTLLDKKSGSGVLLQLIGGLFLTFTVISPITTIDPDALLDSPWELTEQGNAIAAQGQAMAQEELQSIIKAQCEAYILDKAQTYQAALEVEVTLNQEEIPAPVAVRLQGSVSPYAKQALQQWLYDEMGIPREDQQWVS